jgi:hypothetical protein
MFLSTESVHSACIYSTIIAHIENFGFSQVLVLVRAWAIWGTRKRTTNLIAWSYMGYIVTLLSSSAYSVHAGNSTSLRSVFILFVKMVALL